MNLEVLNVVTLSIIFAIGIAAVMAMIVFIYLSLYRLVRFALERVFFPLWFAHVVQVLVPVAMFRPGKYPPDEARGLLVRYMDRMLDELEFEYPKELAGVRSELADLELQRRRLKVAMAEDELERTRRYVRALESRPGHCPTSHTPDSL